MHDTTDTKGKMDDKDKAIGDTGGDNATAGSEQTRATDEAPKATTGEHTTATDAGT